MRKIVVITQKNKKNKNKFDICEITQISLPFHNTYVYRLNNILYDQDAIN